MAKITATDVSVTLNPEDIDRSPDGRIGIRTFPEVKFGNSALEYTALGIPMPDKGKFGFNFAIKRTYIEQPANGFVYSFDRANHKLRIFEGSGVDGITVANHVGVAPTGNLANLVAAAHAHSLVILANNAGAGTQIIGAGSNTANHALVSNTAAGDTIPGGNTANKGGVETTTPGNSTGNFVGDAPANFVHVIGGGNAAAALSEVPASHAPAPTTLYMEMVGR
jgi:hypothetical protein